MEHRPLESIRAREVMITSTAVASPDTPIAAVIKLIAEHQARCVIVVDDRHAPQGIITERDMIDRAYASEIPGGRLLAGLLRSSETVFEFLAERAKAHFDSAGKVMSAPVVTAQSEDSLLFLIGLMAQTGFRQIPVVQGGRLVGLVRRSDVVEAIASAYASKPKLPIDTDG